ncbi:MAG: ion transporter [Bacteroidota bacterium]
MGLDTSSQPLREKLYEIIFEADTPAGKGFDVILLILILLSVLIVMLETVSTIEENYMQLLLWAEWAITIFFTLEYILRIYSARNRVSYIFSFYGIVDLLSILPAYISLAFKGTHYLLTIRALRLLRVFRILKLGTYLIESQVLWAALRASRIKITVFLTTVLIIVCIMGSTMYLIEGEANENFASIPISMYWAIVTVTTVGYGDIAPVTPIGQFIAAILMILGYGVLAVPTGIVSVELAHASKEHPYTPTDCPHCTPDDHDIDAVFCKFCGTKI